MAFNESNINIYIFHFIVVYFGIIYGSIPTIKSIVIAGARSYVHLLAKIKLQQNKL